MRYINVLLGLVLMFVAVFSATAATIYSTGSDGTALITVDTTTGAATPIGSTGFSETWAAAFTPDGTLWTIVNGFSNGQLATFNTGTGAATPVGTPMGTTNVIVLEADTGGTLYAAGFDGSFYTVNTTTGQLALVGALGFNNIMDLAFDNFGQLYAVAPGSPTDLYTVNPATGAGTFVCSLTGTGGPEMGLMVDPVTNNMYATTYASSSFLYQVNPTTCVAVQIGTGLGVSLPHGGDIFDAAPIPVPVPIPMLSGLNRALLIALLAIMAVFVLRGRVPIKRH